MIHNVDMHYYQDYIKEVHKLNKKSMKYYQYWAAIE